MKTPLTIMFVGKTHSGKTTIAKLLAEKLGVTIIDNDQIDLFTKEHYPKLILFEKKERELSTNKTFNPYLKMQLQAVVVKYALQNNLNIILSNSHITQETRQYQIDLVKSLNSTVAIIYFDISDEILFERIKSANRTTKVLTVSKTMEEMLEKQIKNFVVPTEDGADYFLKIDATKKPNEIIDIIHTFIVKNIRL